MISVELEVSFPHPHTFIPVEILGQMPIICSMRYYSVAMPAKLRFPGANTSPFLTNGALFGAGTSVHVHAYIVLQAREDGLRWVWLARQIRKISLFINIYRWTVSPYDGYKLPRVPNGIRHSGNSVQWKCKYRGLPYNGISL